jgi:hypothetical protein
VEGWWGVGKVPYSQAEEDHELDLFGRLHLQLEYDGDGQAEEYDLGDDLVHHRQAQHGYPVHTFRVPLRGEIPDRADGDALEGRESKERKREGSRESHEAIHHALQPQIGEDAQVQAEDAVFDQEQLKAPQHRGDVGCRLVSNVPCRQVYTYSIAQLRIRADTSGPKCVSRVLIRHS